VRIVARIPDARLCSAKLGSPLGGAMFGLGFWELFLILLIVIIVFGAARLPQLGRGLGEGISNFRDGLNKGKEEKPPAIEEKKTP
jgi:sec-independent protein translocase protein TatA